MILSVGGKNRGKVDGKVDKAGKVGKVNNAEMLNFKFYESNYSETA